MASSIPFEDPRATSPFLNTRPAHAVVGPRSIINDNKSSFRGYAGIHSRQISAMKFLTEELFPGNADPDATCTICLGAIHDAVRLPDCGHVFCRECVVAWLNPFDRTTSDEGLRVEFPDRVQDGGDGGALRAGFMRDIAGEDDPMLEEGDYDTDDFEVETSPTASQAADGNEDDGLGDAEIRQVEDDEDEEDEEDEENEEDEEEEVTAPTTTQSGATPPI
ncbi:MAG: hypothetical protein Q9174_006946, partial [Haloplaca sp. 1 TL-2023]